MKFMRFLIVQLALALFQIDLAVKQEIEQLPEQEEEHLIPGGVVGIKRLHNHGMAGGKAVGHMGSIIKVSGIITLGCIGAFARSLIKPAGNVERTGWAILTGGALSNLYERCRKGYVVDYIRFHSPWKWLNHLVFNLADFFIFIGSVLIVLGKKE